MFYAIYSVQPQQLARPSYSGISGMKIAKDFWFSMGHTLHNHPGKCVNLHGHNYRLQVVVENDQLNAQQMVMDFGDLKDIVNGVIDRDYDHRFLVASFDPRAEALQAIDSTVVVVQYNPTAEMIAHSIAATIRSSIEGVTLSKVTLWETENSFAEV
jgi:6-pyruvoyltetrahydropterin/6-carboxytetrahydropterin synthase